MVAIVAAALGFSAEGWLGLEVIAVAEVGGEEHSGSALGVVLTWMFVAAFIAPPVFGALAQAHSYTFAWRSLAGFELLGIAPAILASNYIRRLAEASVIG